jgi:hypothetical protein
LLAPLPLSWTRGHPEAVTIRPRQPTMGTQPKPLPTQAAEARTRAAAVRMRRAASTERISENGFSNPCSYGFSAANKAATLKCTGSLS